MIRIILGILVSAACAFAQAPAADSSAAPPLAAEAGAALSDAAIFYNEGNTAYRRDDFAEAIELYHRAIDAGARNAGVFYNLGSAEYRLGHIGLAILNYERALRLEPDHEDARANLKFIAELGTDRSEAEDVEAQLTTAVRDTLAVIPPDRLAIGFLAGLLAVCGIVSWWVLGGRRSGLAVVILVLAAVLSVGSAGVQGVRVLTSDEGSAAIVLSRQVEARFEPALTARVAFVLHEGTKIQVERHEDSWALIKVPNGLRGWVPRSSLETI